MQLHRRGIEVRSGALSPDERPSRGRPIDLVHLARQTLGDRGLEREILLLMSRQIAQCMVMLDLASDAERSASAHAIRGAANNVGAFALAAAARHLEDRPANMEARTVMKSEMQRADSFITALLG